MLYLDFLEAADSTPLTKTFTPTRTGYDVEPYPNTFRFISHRCEASSIEEFYRLLTTHAQAGHCLLKGQLDRPLLKESRAGRTVSHEPTQWLVFDVDFDDGFPSIDHLIVSLDVDLCDVSYIVQRSASVGITSKADGLRAHVFMMIENPVNPTNLKLWLRHCNLTVPNLVAINTLNPNGQTLKYPIDVTVCQNDKLIYIAPPHCVGFDDPVTDRYVLVKKARDTVPELRNLRTLNPTVIDTLTQKQIQKLRTQSGLPTRNPRYKDHRSGLSILSNPDTCNVTGCKTARGFTYLNLNGGDSWAYYFPSDEPEILYNFKGEPPVLLKQLSLDFYNSYKNALQDLEPTTVTTESGRIPLVFRDRARDQYYNALYDPQTEHVEYFTVSSKEKLQDFLRQYGIPPPKFIADWQVEFDPSTTTTCDIENQKLNLFSPTPYMLRSSDVVAINTPTINRILLSICGNCEESTARFFNWLAFLYQERRKPLTAWVFHGVQGTGKGLFVNSVLRDIFGAQHTLLLTGKDINDRFNGALHRALVVAVDEYSYDSQPNPEESMATLKNWITEPQLSIRQMHRDYRMEPSHFGLLVMSNSPNPVQLSVNDRRFNVPPPQETRLAITSADILNVKAEIPAFADRLRAHQVNQAQVFAVFENETREQMIHGSATSIELFFGAFRNGTLTYFIEYVQQRMPLKDGSIYAEFLTFVRRWALDAKARRVSTIQFDEINICYAYIIGASQLNRGVAKLRRMLTLNRVPMSRNQRTVEVQFAAPDLILDEYIEESTQIPGASNVHSIQRDSVGTEH